MDFLATFYLLLISCLFQVKGLQSRFTRSVFCCEKANNNE